MDDMLLGQSCVCVCVCVSVCLSVYRMLKGYNISKLRLQGITCRRILDILLGQSSVCACVCTCVCVCVSVCLFVCLSVCLSVYRMLKGYNISKLRVHEITYKDYEA